MMNESMYLQLLYMHRVLSHGDAESCPPGTHSHAFSKSVKSHLKLIPSNLFIYKTV